MLDEPFGAELTVTRCGELPFNELQQLMARYGLALERVDDEQSIPGSFWGDAEAGIILRRVLIRDDTPVHSFLHEACHLICMDEERRSQLHTDSGGDYAEEDAVCYLQVVLSDWLPGYGRTKMLTDMDTWGYSFRLGSAAAWFDADAADARAWLLQHKLLDASHHPLWGLRY